MTTTYNILAATNATFRWTRDLSQLAAVYNIQASIIRMQARLMATTADPPVYEWVSSNSSGGTITFDPVTGLCVFAAPQSAMAAMPARLVHDCRLELANGAIVPVFSGRLTFNQGVTRTSSDSTHAGVTGLLDTVVVDNESSSTPAVVPVSTAAAVMAAIPSLPQAQRAALAQALLSALPAADVSAAGVASVNSSGYLVIAS